MVQINKRKLENSAILLADGVEIGHQQEESISHQDLSGVLANLLSVIRSHRTGWLESNADNVNLRIPAVPQSIITNALEGKIAQNSGAGRRESSGKEEMDEASEKKSNSVGVRNSQEIIVIDDSDEDKERGWDVLYSYYRLFHGDGAGVVSCLECLSSGDRTSSTLNL